MEIKKQIPEKPINEEIKSEIKKYVETKETGSTTHQNLWDVA